MMFALLSVTDITEDQVDGKLLWPPRPSATLVDPRTYIPGELCRTSVPGDVAAL